MQFIFNWTIKNLAHGTCANILTIVSIIFAVLTAPLSLFFCVKAVQEYERAAIFRLVELKVQVKIGNRLNNKLLRMYKVYSMNASLVFSGILIILPCLENYAKVDLRTFDVAPQEILTKDSVTVSVDAVVYYRVNNATISIANVENAHHSTRLLAQTTLRNMLGTHNLHEILSDRELISTSMQVINQYKD